MSDLETDKSPEASPPGIEFIECESTHAKVRQSLNFTTLVRPSQMSNQYDCPEGRHQIATNPWEWSCRLQQQPIRTPSPERPATPGPQQTFVVGTPLASPHSTPAKRPETPSPEQWLSPPIRTSSLKRPGTPQPPPVQGPTRNPSRFLHPAAAKRLRPETAPSPEQLRQMPIHRLLSRPPVQAPQTKHFFAQLAKHYTDPQPPSYNEDTRIGICRQSVRGEMYSVACEFIDGGKMEFHIVQPSLTLSDPVRAKKTFFGP